MHRVILVSSLFKQRRLRVRERKKLNSQLVSRANVRSLAWVFKSFRSLSSIGRKFAIGWRRRKQELIRRCREERRANKRELSKEWDGPINYNTGQNPPPCPVIKVSCKLAFIIQSHATTQLRNTVVLPFSIYEPRAAFCITQYHASPRVKSNEKERKRKKQKPCFLARWRNRVFRRFVA